MEILSVRLVVLCIFALKCFASSSQTFHIRHHMGKCLEFRSNKIVYSSICRDHFKWKGGARLVHVPTGKCVVPETTISDDSFGDDSFGDDSFGDDSFGDDFLGDDSLSSSNQRLILTSSCSGTDSIFQYKSKNHTIKHLMTGKCLAPEDSTANDPADNIGLVLSSDCHANKAKYWLVPQVLYVIRHFGGFCWKYDKGQDVLEIVKTYVCDRFFQQNNKYLRHYATGNCVIFSRGYLRLTSNCSQPETSFNLDSNSILREVTSNKCVRTGHDRVNQPSGTDLQLLASCGGDAVKTRFFEEKNIFNISLISESCDDGSYGDDCTLRKAYITVNGYQYSYNTRGINAVVLDYRSGILEHRKAYDVLEYSSHRGSLAQLLNSLPSDKLLFMTVQDAVSNSFSSSLKSALQRRGVPASFTSNDKPKLRCSMATIAFTGQNRQQWEESVVQPNCVGATHMQKTIFAFRDFKGVDDCSEELGIRTGKMKDAQFSATSTWDASNHMPFHARLHWNGAGWCAAYKAPLSHYLQIDLGQKRMLRGIAMQGHGTTGHHFYKQFNLEYSLDGRNWAYHLDTSNNRKIFNGVQRLLTGETNVNWFSRTLTRYMRVRAVTIDPSSPDTMCIRMELFGCFACGTTFEEINNNGKDKYIMQQYSNKVSFYGNSQTGRNIQVQFSAAASNTTLAQSIDQYNVVNIYTKVTRNGSVVKGAGKAYRIQNPVSGTSPRFGFGYGFNYDDYHELEIAINNKILDAGRESGLPTWNIYSHSEKERFQVIGDSLAIKRAATDHSVLAYNIIKPPKTEYHDGDELDFSISIKHSTGKSLANAYQLQLAVYYDTNYLTLTSYNNIRKEIYMMRPTQNSTWPGMITFYTDTLWLLNHHYINFNFKFNFPNQIFKGNSCEGAVITDFSYKNNLAKLNGNLSTTIGENVPYKCRFVKMRGNMAAASRFAVPGFSILLDDVNNNLYVCKKRVKYAERNLPFCFMQEDGKTSWRSIPNIASVVGMDTSKRMLFGLDPNGRGYVRLDENLQPVMHVDDNEWTSIQSQPHVRTAKTATDVSSLPKFPESSWMLPSSGTHIWSVANSTLLKKVTGKWTSVLRL